MKLPLRAGFIFENDVPLEFRVNISQYQGASFPRGSIHFEMNPNCEPVSRRLPQIGMIGLELTMSRSFQAVFGSAFSDDDPGLSSIANNFFNIDSDIINSTLGFPRQIGG